MYRVGSIFAGSLALLASVAAAWAGDPPTTAPATTQAIGESVVFICDSSGSMLGRKYAAHLRSVQRQLVALKPDQRFAIIFMAEIGDDSFYPLTRELLPVTPEALTRVSTFMEKWSARGVAEPTPALEFAYGLKPDRIVLHVDAPFDDFLSYDLIVRRVQTFATRSPGTKIDTVLLGDSNAPAETALRKIAELTGGTYSHRTTDAMLEETTP